jgi:hypothetical protein
MHHAIVQAAGAGQDTLSEIKNHDHIPELQRLQYTPQRLQQTAASRSSGSLLMRGVIANQIARP